LTAKPLEGTLSYLLNVLKDRQRERETERERERENLGGASFTDNDAHIAGSQNFTFVHGRHAFSIHKEYILSALDDF
jgi:hypothetical protein